ncbi:transcriptional regulator, HxlR family [Sphingomonas sp. NFR04]|nr:transcriptional regulator, HxlR family [Sphingomonas sp. NFR04]
MRSKGFEGMACSMAEVMGALGDRWGALVMRDLLLGLTRYEDLRHSTGATNATLSDRLKQLERSGLVERREYQVRPVRHEYLPTEKGRDLGLLLQAMVQIGDKWRRAQHEEAPLHIVDAQTRRRLKLELVDMESGASPSSGAIALEAGPGGDAHMQWRLARGEAERARRSERLPDGALVQRNTRT